MYQQSKTITLPSPGKLNLFLHINGQREDGYHLLQTVFQFFDYGDTLTFTHIETPQIDITPTFADIPLESNLIYRAAMALKNACPDKINSGVSIDIQKQLPMGGGIGGGSSNAATTLLALNHLWECNLSLDRLAELGLQLGADVPVFIHGNATFAEGVGEIFTDCFPNESWYLILTPNVHVSTQAVFQHPALNRCTEIITPTSWNLEMTRNDCEPLVKKLYPEVANAIEWLVEYAPARMTGTGACVFAAFDSKAAAQTVFNQLPNHLRGFLAKGKNKSPTHLALAQLI
ncbi:4-(cytidine 5'-diphospho)-2-C-methyl-D-erythritol kinase [Algicola sagamiensis]|uniref:4-(cytidine 5'-diphospho)-2-C-methyl-D-erythritol kinase n=1 Tax=Algicola sagamiensis TaxID=163869 RepID=UPI0003617824|nr:4-(cytidine 5'-diphospho)-2-C-methyl-D-erythritol kinase [Algicola sagamiensis]